MRRLIGFLHVFFAVILVWFVISCKDKNTWDPIPGLDKVAPPSAPEVSEKFSRVQDPRIAKDVNFWIFSANDTISSIPYKKGLMVRKSPDLVDVKVIGYVLNDVIKSWAQAKLLELDASTDTTKIRMRLPSIKWDGAKWRLYYTVMANTQASVIGYATSPSLENQVWTDKGFVLGSKPGDPIKAAGPSFIVLPDNSKHYLAYGAKYNGIYLVELDMTTGLPISTPGTRIAYYAPDGTNQRCGFPEIIYNSTYSAFYIFVTDEDGHGYGQNVEVIKSASILGPYTCYSNKDYTTSGRVNAVLPWSQSRILSPYQMYNSARKLNPAWGETGSMGVVKDGNEWYAVNNTRVVASQSAAAIVCTGPFILQIRNLEWLSDKGGWPCVQPTLFNPNDGEDEGLALSQQISNDDIVGIWDYSTRWYERDLKIFNPPGAEVVNFKADGTIDISNNGTSDGTWVFDPVTRRILMHSSIWSTPGGEDIPMVIRRTLDTEYSTSPPFPTILSAAGYNNVYGDMPCIWMKQRVKVN